MANPAPTINQINAFNATQGTTIDFNIIGGTELVRSNRIYIYDLSDNSLICTHLYVSTESIHELPPNTDGSIVYESGKSSADFVNGAQYYAQIQTFTDIAGTEGGSGLSVAKMFWCLVDPTLTITTIPSTISTTSYNVSATYDANTSVVSNIIQQYQFSLYSATGSLLQSSGVVVGSGTQQGTSTTYDISYNFTGLSVGSSYYVVVDVTTTQGMSVSVQSNTFTVSIDTPTLGEATVVNNACDGYISVTSNLSSEYGGSGSGDVVSFETDSENVFTKLQVTLDPVQDLNGYDAPWVGGAGKNKLPLTVSRLKADNTSGTWNGNVYTISGVTFTVQTDDGGNVVGININGTASAQISLWFYYTVQAGSYIVNGITGGSNTTYLFYSNYFGELYSGEKAYTDDGTENNFRLVIRSGQAVSNVVIKPMLRLSSVSDATYAPYENICPISGHTEVDVSVVGKNLIDSSNAISGLCAYQAGDTIDTVYASTRYSHSAPIPAEQGLAVSCRTNNLNTFNQVLIECFDSSGKWVRELSISSFEDTTTPKTRTVPSNTYKWVRLAYCSLSGYQVGTDIDGDVMCVLGETVMPYTNYNGQSYNTPLGQTVYGGTLDVVSGLLTVNYGVLDLGDYGWNYDSTNNRFVSASSVSGIKVVDNDTAINGLCSMFSLCSANQTQSANYNGHLGVATNGRIVARNTAYTDGTAFKTSVTGQKLVYELATPQTYQLTPQQIQTLVGKNNVWSEQGEISLAYHIPITNLLVKRQDVGDVSGSWLTLYSQPITQASDMDFTFIDFTNQYGKTYKYALVPLLTQTQSGVEVEVEGGYTVSDEVQSVFDGVFIVDSTGSQKCKANVGYGNVDMNQTVGTITPIGAKYPVVITNSKNQYHNGSISGTIVPDDYYFNGNLSRIDMVNKRDELEQFLTNKRAKIIKDWNGKIWLVMIMDNVSCTFNNNYGMGIVNFSTNWVEVGDPTNQQDLQATGLIDVGGV